MTNKIFVKRKRNRKVTFSTKGLDLRTLAGKGVYRKGAGGLIG